MKKINFLKSVGGILLLCLVVCVPPCAAQGVALRGLVRAGWREALTSNLGESVSAASSLAFQREVSRQFMPYLVTPSLREFKPVEFIYFEPSVQMQRDMYAQLRQTFKRGMEEIKSINTLAYYQQGSQARVLSSVEIGDRLRRLMQVSQEVNEMRSVLETPVKEMEKVALGLERGKMYLSALGSGLMPSFDENTVPKTLYTHADRAFNESEFFLDTPSSYKTEADLWPATLKVAVLTDSAMTKEVFYQFGVMPRTRQWKTDIFNDPLEFLSSGGYLSYDLIITDILIPNGGGLFLGSILRARGYEKPLLALTAFDEIKGFGHGLWLRGFDGMISTSNSNVYTPQYLDLILHKLNNYFYYRHINGWCH